jgi:hypothetical protein
VFQSIIHHLMLVTERRDVTEWFLGAALIIALVTAAMSLLWFERMP